MSYCHFKELSQISDTNSVFFIEKKTESNHLIFGTFYGPRSRASRLELLETIKTMYQSIAQPLGIDCGAHIAYFGLHIKIHSRPFDLAKKRNPCITDLTQLFNHL